MELEQVFNHFILVTELSSSWNAFFCFFFFLCLKHFPVHVCVTTKSFPRTFVKLKKCLSLLLCDDHAVSLIFKIILLCMYAIFNLSFLDEYNSIFIWRWFTDRPPVSQRMAWNYHLSMLLWEFTICLCSGYSRLIHNPKPVKRSLVLLDQGRTWTLISHSEAE